MEANVFGIPLVVVLPLGLLITCAVAFMAARFLTRPVASPLEWLVTPDGDEDPIFKRDNQTLVKDHSFMQRVAAKIEATTQCQTAPDGDLIRVYKKQKLVGIVMCCEVGRNATPAMVRTVVELAEHLHVRIMFLATVGPAPLDTQRFAKLQKVKLVSV